MLYDLSTASVSQQVPIKKMKDFQSFAMKSERQHGDPVIQIIFTNTSEDGESTERHAIKGCQRQKIETK